MFKERVYLDNTKSKINEAFGVSEARMGELMEWLMATQSTTNKHTENIQAALNNDSFTTLEKIYLVFMIGMVIGCYKSQESPLAGLVSLLADTIKAE